MPEGEPVPVLRVKSLAFVPCAVYDRARPRTPTLLDKDDVYCRHTGGVEWTLRVGETRVRGDAFVAACRAIVARERWKVRFGGQWFHHVLCYDAVGEYCRELELPGEDWRVTLYGVCGDDNAFVQVDVADVLAEARAVRQHAGRRTSAGSLQGPERVPTTGESSSGEESE